MFRAYRLVIVATLTLVATVARAGDRGDLLIDDFEHSDYGTWLVTGNAFGIGPAKGTLENQMQVTGYRGERLINSFNYGDNTTGTLTSPPFKLERPYVVFLIGGGGFPDQTCMNLLYNGQVVRSAMGANTEPGGSEILNLSWWDVSDLVGRMVQIEIIDRRRGTWGHITVDDIVQTDRKPDLPEPMGLHNRALKLSKRYLLIPVQDGAPMARVDLIVDDKAVRQFNVELARSKNEVSFWSHLDLQPFAGKDALLRVTGTTKASAAAIELADELPTPDDLYNERLRPQIHFSQRIGWNNDTNGMVYYDGEWHVYFQHNPYGWKWGNMHWGHAVSRDLVHWEQLPIAIYNPRRGDWAYSGGAVVDHNNTAGWQSGDEKTIVAAWTSTGRGECISYSNDRGRTFTEYAGNPVIKHQGRDPKIIWYAPGQHWVMALYSERDDLQTMAFYTSKNLKEWKYESCLPGFFECPELFELPIDGDENNTHWVIFAADAQYTLGKFDGRVFTPLHEGKHRVHYGDYYASQTFSDAPENRRIQIGWARIEMPGMRFNQAFSFPHELTLRTTADGVRLFAEPVREIETLYRGENTIEQKVLTANQTATITTGVKELFDIVATFKLLPDSDATAVGVLIGDERIRYNISEKQLAGAYLKPINNEIEIRVLVDRPMLEIIGNRGRVYITKPRHKPGRVSQVGVFAEGGRAELLSLRVHDLESIWRKGR